MQHKTCMTARHAGFVLLCEQPRKYYEMLRVGASGFAPKGVTAA